MARAVEVTYMAKGLTARQMSRLHWRLRKKGMSYQQALASCGQAKRASKTHGYGKAKRYKAGKFHDSDGDGTVDHYDCRPFDKQRQDSYSVPIDEAYTMRSKGNIFQDMSPKRPPENMARLESSMRKRGFIEPINASREEWEEGRLQDGKHRILIAKKLGISHIPVNVE